MIRQYEEKDYDAMREFYFQILYESRHFLPYTPTLNSGFFNASNRDNYVLIEDGKIIAHLTIVNVDGLRFSVGLAVLKEHWGNGYGSKLLDYAEDKVKEKNGNKMLATIHTDNWRSILLFIKNGFRITNETDNLCLEKEL